MQHRIVTSDVSVERFSDLKTACETRNLSKNCQDFAMQPRGRYKLLRNQESRDNSFKLRTNP